MTSTYSNSLSSLACGPSTWFPCLEDSNQNYFWSFYVTVPNGYKVILPGELKDIFKNKDASIMYYYYVKIPMSALNIEMYCGRIEETVITENLIYAFNISVKYTEIMEYINKIINSSLLFFTDLLKIEINMLYSNKVISTIYSSFLFI